MLPPYAELHCRSNFSFLTGASHPEELVAQAQARGYTALALTDECSLAGVVRAHGEAVRLGMPFIVGAQMQLELPAAQSPASAAPVDVSPPLLATSSVLTGHAAPRLLLLAQSRRGYGNLSQWITVARRRAAKGQYRALVSDLEGRVPHAPFLAGLPGCFAILLPQAQQSEQTIYATRCG